MELNASNDRGIETVRNKIKMFAQQKVTLPQGRHKIIVLDEADSMTESAQQALRRTMELYSSTTRFALACNSSEKIIEPIQSRCAMLRYSKLTDAQVLAKVLAVCEAEGVDHSEDGLEAVVFTAQVLSSLGFSQCPIKAVYQIYLPGRHASSSQQSPVHSRRIWFCQV